MTVTQNALYVVLAFDRRAQNSFECLRDITANAATFIKCKKIKWYTPCPHAFPTVHERMPDTNPHYCVINKLFSNQPIRCLTAWAYRETDKSIFQDAQLMSNCVCTWLKSLPIRACNWICCQVDLSVYIHIGLRLIVQFCTSKIRPAGQFSIKCWIWVKTRT